MNRNPRCFVIAVDMILGIGNMICQGIVVAFVIAGVVIILLAIHFGAGYLFGDRESDAGRLRDELEAESGGISRHNLFYRFFFRNQ